MGTAAYRLTPIQESDLDFLYLLATHDGLGQAHDVLGDARLARADDERHAAVEGVHDGPAV